MTLRNIVCAVTLSLGLAPASGFAQDEQIDLKFAGALEFSDTGTLFVGDNYGGAIYAIDMTGGSAPDQVNPVNIGDIDFKIADVLGVARSAVAINDMVTHPITAEIFISTTRIGNFESAPAIMKVSQQGEIELLDLTAFAFQKQALNNYPELDTTFRPRGLGKSPLVSNVE